MTSRADPGAPSPRTPAERPYRWRFEVRGGALATLGTSRGTAAPLPPGRDFTTEGGSTTRRVASWYFGDGAEYFNSLSTSIRAGQTMVPLDPALYVLGTRRPGGSVGARLAVRLTRRLDVEVTIDSGLRTLVVDKGVETHIEASRASFVDAWTGVTRVFASPSVTSEASLSAAGGRQLVTVGAVVLDLGGTRRVRPFITGGAGISATAGEPPTARLTGRYSFAIPVIGAPFAETDSVTVRYGSGRVPVGAIGGGFTYDMGRRSGIRLEIRAIAGPNPARTTLDARPSIESQITSAAILATSPSPALQFVNNTSSSTTSSLNGPIRNLVTYKAGGWATTLNTTVGWYWRF